MVPCASASCATSEAASEFLPRVRSIQKFRVYLAGVLIIRALLFGVYIKAPDFLETPNSSGSQHKDLVPSGPGPQSLKQVPGYCRLLQPKVLGDTLGASRITKTRLFLIRLGIRYLKHTSSSDTGSCLRPCLALRV